MNFFFQVHKGVRKECPECGKVLSDLWKHMRTVHGHYRRRAKIPKDALDSKSVDKILSTDSDRSSSTDLDPIPPKPAAKRTKAARASKPAKPAKIPKVSSVFPLSSGNSPSRSSSDSPSPPAPHFLDSKAMLPLHIQKLVDNAMMANKEVGVVHDEDDDEDDEEEEESIPAPTNLGEELMLTPSVKIMKINRAVTH